MNRFIGTFAILFMVLAGMYGQALADCVIPGGAAQCNGVPCAGQTRATGHIIYNADHEAVQVCLSDGSWSSAPRYDYDPVAFSFTDQTGVATGTLITSDNIAITGLDTTTGVSISVDGSPEFRINGGSWTTSGTISNGQTLQLRLTSNASGGTMNSATVTVGTISDQWDVTTAVADPCAGSPSPGDVCANGSVYAGLSPDGNVPMYTTPADAGQFTWDNGSGNYIDTPMSNTSFVTGEANTTLLAGLSNADAPYAAATYCDGLSAHGNSDWYLPARNELNVLYTNRTTIGGFNTTGTYPSSYYWSSSEDYDDSAWYVRLSDGDQNFTPKDDGLSVRCVRR